MATELDVVKWRGSWEAVTEARQLYEMWVILLMLLEMAVFPNLCMIVQVCRDGSEPAVSVI